MEKIPPEIWYIIYRYKNMFEINDMKKIVHKQLLQIKKNKINGNFSLIDCAVFINPFQMIGFSGIYNSSLCKPCYCNLCGEFKEIYYRDIQSDRVNITFCNCIFGLNYGYIYSYKRPRIKAFCVEQFIPYPLNKFK